MEASFLRHAARDLPRYTSYPTAVAFGDLAPETAKDWAQAITAHKALSVYVHTPFCDQLCWYCGCHTTVPNGYGRVSQFVKTLDQEIDLWAKALPAHGGTKFIHFGGGSPNALSAADFSQIAAKISKVFEKTKDAEVAVELDPRSLTLPFIHALETAGVNRASLGVQTFDEVVQKKVNRIQPYEMIAQNVARLRDAGVLGINFDLMYGLPGQSPQSVAESAKLAAALQPDRIAVFGYAHVPWFKKHQTLILDEDLPDLPARWASVDAADEVLTQEGYVRVGLDHYARPHDPLVLAQEEGRLRRNFQGYTTDPAEILIPLGPSSIGRLPQGYVQNAKMSNLWSKMIEAETLPIERGLSLDSEDRLRAQVIETLMCDLRVDVGAICRAMGFDPNHLDAEIDLARGLVMDGLCYVTDRHVEILPKAHRLMRVVAACFDARLAPPALRRHAKAV